VVRLLTGRPIAFPPPEEALDYPYTEQERALLENIEARSTVGTPAQVKKRLTALAERHGAEELVIVTITYDAKSRLKSYELLAKEFGLAPP
jgi:alkanesulfonate monooxygenase SsuD/methylene tetrahydromethanopterin reductase-like flavin-dependent oxidoreductase (luciferase family)